MPLDTAQTFQLVSLLAVLALFCFSLRDTVQYRRWFRRWEGERKSRREAHLQSEADQAREADDATPRGPWG